MPPSNPRLSFTAGDEVLLGSLEHPHNPQFKGSATHKLCEFFISAVGLIDALHSPDVRSRKAIGALELLAEIVGEIPNDALAPCFPLLPLQSSAQCRRRPRSAPH